jgi:hypothetical protein
MKNVLMALLIATTGTTYAMDINLIATCVEGSIDMYGDGESREYNADELSKELERAIGEDIGVDNVSISERINIGEKEYTLAGPGFIANTNYMFQLRVNYDTILKNNIKYNADLNAGVGPYKRENGFSERSGLKDYLNSMSMGFAGLCDILVPTRLDLFSKRHQNDLADEKQKEIEQDKEKK